MTEKLSRCREKPTLVHVATVPGTLWSFLAGQIGFMKEHGFEVEAIASPGELLDRFASREQVAAHGVAMARRITPWKDCVALARIWRLLMVMQPEVVHSHTPKGGLLGMVAAWLARVPVRVYHMRGLPLATATGFRRRILWWTERVSCLLAHRVLCISHSIAREAVALGLCPANKVAVLGSGGNGVDAQNKFNRQRLTLDACRQVRASCGIPSDAPVIGFVGRIVRDKGCVELVEAWIALRKAFPSAHLMMIGEFESQDPLPHKVKSLLQNDQRVHLTGRIADVAPYYGAMDILVLPTYREGFPNVAVEAAAMELPVVATSIPGCVDAIVDGTTGTLVPSRDAQALAATLGDYLGDPERCRRHGLAGRRRVLAEFRREPIWQELHDLYVDLMRRRGLTASADRSEAAIPSIESQRRAA